MNAVQACIVNLFLFLRTAVEHGVERVSNKGIEMSDPRLLLSDFRDCHPQKQQLEMVQSRQSK